MIRPLRAFWRWLTSMRTALLLLFLLAVASVPGSLLPQRNIAIERVNSYLTEHQTAGPWLDRLSMFDVYASPWFSAIYLLLFASLIGCLVPRLRQHLGALVAQPPDAPSRLDRLPHHADGLAHDSDPATTAAGLRSAWRGRKWRVAVREHPDGTVTVAAEKGYLKESGNLLFHVSLMAVLVGVAFGSWYGWHGNRVLVAGAENAFCDTLAQYDEYGLGARVTGADLPPFCVQLDDFHAEYLDDGQPKSFSATVSYGTGTPDQQATLAVNDPLRLDGANVYLQGHGYAPVLRYTDRYGVVQTVVSPFFSQDAMLTSHGVVTFPDANVDPTGATPRDPAAQIAFAGLYLPTVPDDVSVGQSAFPAERDPALMLNAYQGNLGLDVGLAKSVYELDQAQIDSGELKQIGTKKMRVGDSWTLPDGSKVEFLGTRQWVALSVRHDPGELTVLGAVVALLIGLMVSLSGKRRRVWARVSPDGQGRSLVSLGGLTRSEYQGFTTEFAGIVALSTAAAPSEPAEPPSLVASRKGE